MLPRENEQRILESPKRLEDSQRAVQDRWILSETFLGFITLRGKTGVSRKQRLFFHCRLNNNYLHGKEVASTSIIHSHLYPCLAT